MNVLLHRINIYTSQFRWKQTGNLCSNQTDGNNTHMLNTHSDPRCLTAAEKHQITSLIHEVPRPLPTSPPPAIPPMGCLTSPKADVQYKHLLQPSSTPFKDQQSWWSHLSWGMESLCEWSTAVFMFYSCWFFDWDTGPQHIEIQTTYL